MISLRRICLATFAAALLIPLGATAEEPVVKHEETPAPKAGPTVAASEGFCGEPSGTADELAKRYAGRAGLTKIDESKDYVTYSDDPKAATVMYNFSTDSNPAHPIAVCRKLVKEGDEMTLKYNVVCGGPADSCAKATSDFNVLIARMQAAVNEQIAGKKK